jgi:hypothetical protein
VAFSGREAEPGWQVAVHLPGLDRAATADAVVTPVPHVTDTSEAEQRLLARAASGDALTDDERAVTLPALFRRLIPVADGEAAIDLTLPGIRPWSGEDPHLEPLEVELRAPDGAVVERAALRIGFRRVEIVGRDLLINGARVFVRGINRHDFDQHTGRVIAADSIRDDLVLMRRFGFNAGIGLDAELVRRVDQLGRNKDGKRPGDITFGWTMLRTIAANVSKSCCFDDRSGERSKNGITCSRSSNSTI